MNNEQSKKSTFVVRFIVTIIIFVFLFALRIYMSYEKKDDKEQINSSSSSLINKCDEQIVYVYGWNNQDKMFGFCSIENNGDENQIVEDSRQCSTSFSTNKSIDQIVEQNTDYIGDFKYLDCYKMTPSKLFFDGENYFVLISYDDENSGNYYSVKCCMATIVNEGWQDVFFPCPAGLSIDFDVAEIYLNTQNEGTYIDLLYDNYTFEEACEFYGRMPNEYVVIDKDNQTILVDAYQYRSRKELDKYVTLDWKNKTISYDDLVTEEHIVFDGYPKKEAPLTKSVFAKSWFEKDNEYEICKIHEVDSVEYNENKLEMAVDTFKSGDKYPALTDDFKCVGDLEYCIYNLMYNKGKLVFGQNNYYMMFYSYEKERYIVSSCCGKVDVNDDDTVESMELMNDKKDVHDDDIIFPFPGRIVFSDSDDEGVREMAQKHALSFFKHMDFEKGCEFYNLFTNDCASIDKNNQTITVDGYDRANDKYIEGFIIIDWKNKTFTYTVPGSIEKVVYKGQ